jgi:16S rRNA (uracil1498-N3)-methyltransferase
MNRFFINHKLTEGDITRLSDNDSEFAIKELGLQVEDIVEIENYQSIFHALVTDIYKNSVEVEIKEKIEDKKQIENINITILQSLSNDTKFNYFIEKSVEVGVDRIIPIETQNSLRKREKAIKDYGLWNKIVRDAVEQSRNIKPTIIEKPIKLKDLKIEKDTNRICLATENVNPKLLREYINSIKIEKPFYIAIGPEKGWGVSDINTFKELDFTFVKMGGNILRTETAGLIITSIIKYLKEEI